MHKQYTGVISRFLRHDERLVLSNENEMPLVIEADGSSDLTFLQTFLSDNSEQLLQDVSKYGAVLFRGFNISSDENFEKSLLSIKGLRGISDAFMSEEGRIHPDNAKFVLHTNAVYKTGGTLYLGGFHSENYYSTDVPSYISFCCLKPSVTGGETGLINMEKIYPHLDEELKNKLDKNTFFVSKWLVSAVAERYQISVEQIEILCKQFDIPIIGKGDGKFILMYKPSIFEDALTKKKSLQINLFEIKSLNDELRKCFLPDYQGKMWFWHRVVWKLPSNVFSVIERISVALISFSYSPKDSIKILLSKIKAYRLSEIPGNLPEFNDVRVGHCFTDQDIKKLAVLMRDNYSSCLWKKGDLLLVDNKKVVHAGMPGSGPRLIRAIICNPIDMKYSYVDSGTLICRDRAGESVGFYISQTE